MLRTIFQSFGMAFSSIRSRFFHTILSVLGIIIGVAALVGTLSLIDGMEKYANEQINKTTSLKAVFITSNLNDEINNIRVRKDSITMLTNEDIEALKSTFSIPLKAYLSSENHRKNIWKKEDNAKMAAFCNYTSSDFRKKEDILTGRYFTKEEVDEQAKVVFVNYKFAEVMDSLHPKQVVGKSIILDDKESYQIIGMTNAEAGKNAPIAIFPITHLTNIQLQKNPPRLILEAEDVAEVPMIKKSTEDWLATRFENSTDKFQVFDNGHRVKQANEGFLLFRVIMGMIVGLSVLVGGIGVMNVLLISVSERTSEIGIRKALGASKRMITTQFLSESIAVSIFGSLIGLILGMLFSLAAIPIIKAFVDIPFYASFSINTMITIGIISILIGIIFGTYPALKAAKMDPVVAIQRE
jgi:putative ABC transport system permease protein